MVNARGILAPTLAISIAGLASCADLGGLECQGDCLDASAGDGSVPSLFCGANSLCDSRTQECCVATGGSTSCTNRSACSGGTDIVCDDPRQCSGGGSCWICISGQGFQGTSCNYQGDIVGLYHCDTTTALRLCHATSQCPAGKTCEPLAVEGLSASAGTTWFSACQ